MGVFAKTVQCNLNSACNCFSWLKKIYAVSLRRIVIVINVLHLNYFSMIIKEYTAKHCKVTFKLPNNSSFENSDIRVLGTFNNWVWESGARFTRTDNGFEASVQLEHNKTYEFRYLQDEVFWFNDEQADSFVPSPYLDVHNSVLETSGYVPPKKTSKPQKQAADKDDLKLVEGIGPKIEELLNSKGITTFEQLCATEVTTLQNLLEEAGPRFRIHNPTTWPQQAGMAHKGEWEQLKKWQDELKAGKPKK
ncbi:hypothetical protein C7N43_25810 [Sphingobacteriales bacterium UPWRP_1]|nr:hypothetical protein B6N25_15985 [Sphingobacteriales bacterium TSM_CSS]PSJ74085.1 hypothetical protein C7N43_25810 [Sphingobacteriales bacterium UPWRP_1]